MVEVNGSGKRSSFLQFGNSYDSHIFIVQAKLSYQEHK